VLVVAVAHKSSCSLVAWTSSSQVVPGDALLMSLPVGVVTTVAVVVLSKVIEVTTSVGAVASLLEIELAVVVGVVELDGQ